MDGDPRARPSLLLPPGVEAPQEGSDHESLRDLNLDRVIESVLAGLHEYGLETHLRTPLPSVNAVRYRHAVLRDLQEPQLRGAVRTFAAGLHRVRDGLQRSERARHPVQRRLVFLEAAQLYVGTVADLASALGCTPHRSAGIAGLTEHVAAYAASPAFASLDRDAREVAERLAGATFRLQLRQSRVTVSRPVEDEGVHADELAAVFGAFLGEGRSSLPWLPAERDDSDPLEIAIAERAAQLHPDAFAALERFCSAHRPLVSPDLDAAARELRFYLGVLDWSDRLTAAGLPVCLPEVTDSDAGVRLDDAYDAALALAHAWDHRKVVPNDVELEPAERVVVVTGPNQGGKTTFARAVGQVLHLASVGLPVPARAARVPLVDRVVSNFARGEDLHDQRGALERDVVRCATVLGRATPRSVVVLNEVFTSTTVQDALLLSRRVLDRVLGLNCLCVWVTFLDELAGQGPAVVSYVSQVDPDDPTIRTFEVTRCPSGGPTYAELLARAHGLDADAILRRLAR